MKVVGGIRNNKTGKEKKDMNQKCVGKGNESIETRKSSERLECLRKKSINIVNKSFSI